MRSLIALSIMLVLSLSSCKFIKEKGWFGKNKADTMAVWQARQDSIRVADSIRVEIEKMKAIEQARIDSIQAAEQAQIELEASFRFHIIVGSFLTPEYATDWLNFYLQSGYSGAQIIMDHNQRFNLVSAEAHDNLNEAIRRLHSFQDTVDFDAWLYIND